MEDCERRTLAVWRPCRENPPEEPSIDRWYNDGMAEQAEPQVVSSEQIFQGRVFRVRQDVVERDGERHKLDIVEHPGSYAVAALPAPDRIVLVRQYRHAAGQLMWEIPAGTAEAGESREEGARRELREETGYTADSLELLCSLYPTPGYDTERVHVYAARGLHAGPQQLEDDERIDVREFTFEQALSMQASGEIADMKTVVALLWLGGGRV